MAIIRNHDLFQKVIKNFWEYYRELEDEFLLTRRYVDFSDENFNTFSVEYLKLYQAVCSEIDVIGKAMAQTACSSFVPEDRKNNITKWWFCIQDEYFVAEGPLTKINPSRDPVKVSLQNYKCYLLGDYELQPWKNYKTQQYTKANKATSYKLVPGCSTPSWWLSYNAVKHHRISLNSTDANYNKANLGNVINAFAALYILERAFLDTIGTADDLQTFCDYTRLFYKQRILTFTEMNELYGFENQKD